ncbi:AraC family transcriptional regulator [Gorillibacterium sp. CAU 1737]|uniref:AraC family transcriptional regulator n=1 Tax=Gorillibacterium sp. CAU 1737 TaxID=3140362 RepID=UPI0032619B30
MKAYHEHRSYSSPLPLSTIRLRNFVFLAHWHNDVELIYVTEGSIRIGINAETRILQAGDLAVCSSGDIHYYDSQGMDSELVLIIFNPRLIGFPGGWPKDVRITSPFLEAAGQPPDSPAGELSATAAKLFPRIRQESAEMPPHYEMIVTGLLHELCGTLLRHVASEPLDPRREKRLGTSRKAMQHALDYLDTHYNSSITLEDLARQANMSVFHFSRFFKSTTGMSCLSYLNNIRVNKAEEMILATDKTILEIALECGFTNVRTFNRVFRQFRDCAPSSLR